MTENADETEMLTVWFSLWDAPVASGCLEVIPYSHRAGLQRHCPALGGPKIVEAVLEREAALAQPMRRGDVIFMTRYTQHASLPNISDSVRWSFDLRYNPIGPAHRARHVPRLRGAQPQQPGQRSARCPRLGAAVV